MEYPETKWWHIDNPKPFLRAHWRRLAAALLALIVLLGVSLFAFRDRKAQKELSLLLSRLPLQCDEVIGGDAPDALHDTLTKLHETVYDYAEGELLPRAEELYSRYYEPGGLNDVLGGDSQENLASAAEGLRSHLTVTDSSLSGDELLETVIAGLEQFYAELK